MHTADYLICYDIADERRLAKLARYLEKLAIRVQYSIFFYQADSEGLAMTVEKIREIIDAEVDDVRIYRIKLPAVTMGDAIDLSDPLLLV